MQGLCILAHDMDVKGDYIIYIPCKKVIEAESMEFCITKFGCVSRSIKCHWNSWLRKMLPDVGMVTTASKCLEA